VLAGDVDKARGDIAAAGKNDPLDAGADRSLGGAGVVTAIEQRGGLRRWHRLSGRGDQFPPPSRPRRNPGIGGAEEGDGPPGSGCRA